MIDSSGSSDSDASTTSRKGASRKKRRQHRQRQHRLSHPHVQQQQRQRHLHRQNHPYGVLPADNEDIIEGDFLGSINNEKDQRHFNEYSVAEIGRPPKRLLRKKERMTFKIHDFAQSSEKRGEYRITPVLQAHGYNWKLQVYPRGDNRSKETSEYISCFLHYFPSPNDKEAPVAKVEYRCGAHKTETQICKFVVQKGNTSTSWGLENFLARNRVLHNYLDEDGALTIHIDVRIAVDPKIVWYPSPMRREPTLIQLYYSSEETADVTFRLTGSSNDSGGDDDDALPSTAVSCYRAHKMILALRAKILYELHCEESSALEDDSDSDCKVVDLPGIDWDLFEAMLEHIYTVKQPTIENEATAKKLLLAADRFCLTDLKLYVESVLVDRFVTAENAASLLLLADSHSCALLKEASMDLYVSDPASVIRSPEWAMVEESEKTISELLVHVHTSCRNCFYEDNRKNKETTYNNDNNNNINNNDDDQGDDSSGSEKDSDDEINRLDIFSLREQLCEEGLDVDGSRETLVARLRDSQEKVEERE